MAADRMCSARVGGRSEKGTHRGKRPLVGLPRWLRSAFSVSVCALLVAACRHADHREPTPAPAETTAATRMYLPQDGVEAPYIPESSRARNFHLIARHVRHRHAGPR
jgi:hypothetical protein